MQLYLGGRERRKRRIRKKIHGTAERPRMSVFRSAAHIGVQLVDDEKGVTLASSSTYEKNFAGKKSGNCEAAKVVGEMIAERAKSKGIDKVVFDRNGFLYHGRLRALADAARQKGLKF